MKKLQQSNKLYAVIKTKTNSDLTSTRKKALTGWQWWSVHFSCATTMFSDLSKRKPHSLSLTCTMSWIEMPLQFTHFLPVPVLPERASFYLFSPESLCKSLNWFPFRLLLDSPLSGLSQLNSERLNFVIILLWFCLLIFSMTWIQFSPFNHWSDIIMPSIHCAGDCRIHRYML